MSNELQIRIRQGWVGLAAAVAVLVGTDSATAQDSNLFQVRVAPNVMLMVDNSASMNHVVWHPAYDPDSSSSCGFFPEETIRVHSYYSWGGSGDRYIPPGTYTLCGNTREIFADSIVTAAGNATRWSGHYLNWYFSDSADPYAGEVVDDDNGERSACLTDPSGPNMPASYPKYRRTRIAAAKEVLREVVCQVNAEGQVRFGLGVFYRSSVDPRGGYVPVPIADYTPSQASEIDVFIEDELEGESWTPLSETLFNVYRYFQSRSNPAIGKNGSTEFPRYNIRTNGYTTTNNSLVPGSPVENACQKNFVIIITDGEPTRDDFDQMNKSQFLNELIGDYNPDNASPENGSELTSNSEGSWYLDDVAMFMQQNDFHRDYAGTQVIDVYTVGFTTSDDANAILEKTADVGNGLFFFSNNAEELTSAIVDAVTDILEKSQSFTSATVPASRTTDGSNFYSSYFLPREDQGFWEGHLKNFEFSGAGDILAADGSCATGPTGTLPPGCPSDQLRTSATAFWDAATVMPAPGARKLYVGSSGTVFGTKPNTWGNVDKDDLSLTAADLSSAPYDTLADLDEAASAIMEAFQGCEFGSDPCVARTNEAGGPAILGDVFHSNPVVVGSPNSAINDSVYQQFAAEKRSRSRVIYAGANDGFLHGFNAGDWRNFEADGVTPKIPPVHDRGTGVEIFGFMPAAIRDVAKELPKVTSFPRMTSGIGGSPIVPLETVDGSPVVADVWIQRDVLPSGNLGSVNPTLSSESKQVEQWRTVLLGGLRNGGNSYYALDITDPPSSSGPPNPKYPLYLWEFPCNDCSAAGVSNPGTSVEVSQMGASWSEPVITRVRVASSSSPAAEGYERWVAIFGAGYHRCGDPYSAFYTSPTECVGQPDEARGRAIYMVDLTTGEVLAKKYWSAAAEFSPAGSGTQMGFPEMRFGFASSPAVFDLDFDGFADIVYIGDLGGNVWKWVIHGLGDDPVHDSGAEGDPSQPDWPFRLFFQASSAASPMPAAASVGYPHQSFYFPPTGVLRDGQLVLALGAGQRENPQYSDDDGLEETNNHYYVIEDSDPFERSATAPNSLTGFLSEDDLATNAQIDSQTCSNIQSNFSGFFLTGRDSEKFITNSVVFLGDLYFGSFVPPDPSTADPCNSTGESYLYSFDVDCANGSFTPNPGTGNEDRRLLIGTGLPTRPRVSVGGLNEGNATASCNNKVIVITSDGGIQNQCKTLPSRGINIRSWRSR
ncbi:hypothetical protein MK489_10375 [Myxococcota bacterium]|nr:hypothetical protein [Myxococcota bacterium]